ncbi:hypothetical protein [uncultured Chryseobacterium sp.]|uniref:hypothetical protein n=1 Tax=uncultured Chryseobacterium sp. TaxID=259322 RepID=UPI0025F1C16C|nr:hypothetical protein [uncultured Chryseobacterium sp.]
MVITKLYIIDWYDDIITAIILFENSIYLCNCIQKDIFNEEKIYYCVKIDEELFKQIAYIMDKKSFTQKDWDKINLIFEKSNKYGNVFLLKIPSLLVGLDITLTEVKHSDIINIEFPFDISILF